VLNEFYRVAFRKKVYRSIDELQADLDLWMREYNEQRPHQGRAPGPPSMTLLDARSLPHGLARLPKKLGRVA
jgi:hypothetical protein